MALPEDDVKVDVDSDVDVDADVGLDIEFVRSHFPAFSDDELAGWAFFENAGGSWPCTQVVERLHSFYMHHKVQPYAPYNASARAGERMDEAWENIAAYLNVDPVEVSFGPSTSQNVYVLAQAFSANWRTGDEIVVTNQDHEANSGPWRRLADKGIVVREWQVDPATGCLELESLDQLLSAKTRLVAFPHCSNIVAHINPVKKICERVRKVGARTVVDGVSYAGHGFPDVTELGADVYLFSTYKTFGPHLGAMVVRKQTMELLENQSHFFNADQPRSKLVPAGPDHAQIAAAAGITEYFDAVYTHHFNDPANIATRRQRVRSLFQRHERRLLENLLNYLGERADLELIGPANPAERAPTVSLVSRHDHEYLVQQLSEKQIMCWNGDFYSRRLIEALGINPASGVVRLSFVHYTSEGDIRNLIAALDSI